MYHGLGYGDNFQAVLISNAAREMRRFMKSTCEGPINIKKSAYLGDLLVTCYSQFSRNRMLGNMLGKGYTVKSAKAEMTMVAEGYYAVPLVAKIRKKHEVKMPLSRQVNEVLYEGKSAKKVMAEIGTKIKLGNRKHPEGSCVMPRTTRTDEAKPHPYIPFIIRSFFWAKPYPIITGGRGQTRQRRCSS